MPLTYNLRKLRIYATALLMQQSLVAVIVLIYAAHMIQLLWAEVAPTP